MKKLYTPILLLVILLLAVAGLAACSGGQATMTDTHNMDTMADTEAEPMADDAMAANAAMTETAIMSDTMDGAMDEEADDTMTETHTMTDSASMTETSAMDAGAMAMDARPAWQQLSLVDARSGASFTLADFAGKTVFVETMATWCTNCRQQLNNVKSLHATLDDPNIVFVALSVETNLDASTLAQYADDAGFDWTFAVITPELLQELATNFGRTITNPPSTPHFIIRPDGSTTDLTTGIETAEQLSSQLQNAGG